MRKDAGSVQELDKVIEEQGLTVAPKTYDCLTAVFERMGETSLYTNKSFRGGHSRGPRKRGSAGFRQRCGLPPAKLDLRRADQPPGVRHRPGKSPQNGLPVAGGLSHEKPLIGGNRLKRIVHHSKPSPYSIRVSAGRPPPGVY